MDWQVIWFVLIAVLFVGFFFLEGFDYGVGILLPFVARTDTERRILINTIGPVWDGNEVWMITAGGALFAAFPHVYATLFSGFYFALFLLLLALIVRGVAFEFRSKDESKRWRASWDWLIFFGSFTPALLWGVVMANLIQGLPIDARMQYTGAFFDLLSPYALVGGAAFLLVFTFHGGLFLTLKVESEALIATVRRAALRIGALAAACFALLVVLTYARTDLFESAVAAVCLIAAAAAFILGWLAARGRRYGRGFALSSAAIVLTTIAFFAGLFPRLMVSSLRPEWSLTIHNASSTPYTLSIMTLAAIFVVPLVLGYQGWTYWVFRKRVSAKHLEY